VSSELKGQPDVMVTEKRHAGDKEGEAGKDHTHEAVRSQFSVLHGGERHSLSHMQRGAPLSVGGWIVGQW
jgi:hypothetical protein